jgi:hypothetical protein
MKRIGILPGAADVSRGMWFCSLDDEQLAQRRLEWQEVGAGSRVGPSAWRDEPGVRERLEALIAAEAECCPGLRFDLRVEDGVLQLEVEMPGEPQLT